MSNLWPSRISGSCSLAILSTVAVVLALSVSQTFADDVRIGLPNLPPGTVRYKLVYLTLEGGVTSDPTDNEVAAGSEAIGICQSGCGKSGTAQVLMVGVGFCVFEDNSVRVGDYVGVSASDRSLCKDRGESYPTNGQVIGRVLDLRNSPRGTFPILLLTRAFSP
jgi:hypothetical protein